MPLFFLFRVIVMYGFGGGFVTGVLGLLLVMLSHVFVFTI